MADVSKTLAEILAALSDLDNAATIEFDPKDLTSDLADKVDAIHAVMERLEGEAERLQKRAAEFQIAAKSIARNAERLEEYVRWTMEQTGFEKLPGNDFVLRIQNSAQALKTERLPTAEDAVVMPEFVKRTTSYSWIADTIKIALKAGQEFKYGRLVEGKKQVRFDIRKGAK